MENSEIVSGLIQKNEGETILRSHVFVVSFHVDTRRRRLSKDHDLIFGFVIALVVINSARS
jgi:hypothetical protein